MSWKRFIPFWRRNGVPEKSLIDREYVEESLNNSPIPIMLIIVLLWVVSAVLLILSENSQRDLTVWVDGQKAPFSVWARTGFSYHDTSATEKLRNEAAKKEPVVYRIDRNELNRIKLEFTNFFSSLQLRENAENEKKLFHPENNTGSKLAAGMIEYRPILKQIKNNSNALDQQLTMLLRHGVIGQDQLKNLSAGQKLRIVSPDERSYYLQPPAPRQGAEKLAEVLKLSGNIKEEFIRCAALILERGDLIFDRQASADAANAARNEVKPVIKKQARGDLLIERHQLITREHVDMFQAEIAALPHGYGIVLLGNRLALSFLLLLTMLFFLYRTYPKIFNDPQRFSIAGMATIMALVANYGALQLFFYFFRHGIMPDYELMLFMVPIPFGAALLSILLGNRTALFSGFLIAAISSLMILPDRSFELALRWFAIAALMTMLIRNVTNYRSFFMRVFLCGALLTIVVNSDILYAVHHDMRLIKLALLATAGNAFICAMTALLAVFGFELVFNADTSMSLLVLCDHTHPLLDKLKREAPGTMFHSMTVATLAEDAALAINANAARAKAGALFHDIGKLSMPQYFIENNVDSPQIYRSMPPQRSCGIIRGHVKEGLLLAREYHLCGFVRKAIATHHGDDLISFFYQRALEENDGENPAVLEAQFRYDGEPPDGKELTIISLADACEAASRSLNKPSPAKLEALVENIFLGRLRGGQLRNSELTLEELNTVRECFVADLISFNHGRIAYQKESHDDTITLPLEESQTSGTEKK